MLKCLSPGQFLNQFLSSPLEYQQDCKASTTEFLCWKYIIGHMSKQRSVNNLLRRSRKNGILQPTVPLLNTAVGIFRDHEFVW